ncbi:MAG: DNA-processing protein DprA, partial [Myxococcota bacterium]
MRVRSLTPFDSGYPILFGDLSNPPPCVHIAGQLPDLCACIAVVGTRVADEEALDFTRRLAADLVRSGAVIVSGGALGIDRAAHEGALDAGGPTIVVLPLGLDQLYPRDHGPLFERVAASGCLLTEVDPGAPMRKGRFLARNRLIAAIATSTVVIQAPARSGAMSTAHHAKRLGRKVFVVPASPWDPRGLGNLALLERGARICTRASDVLSGSASAGPLRGSPGAAQGRENPNYGHLSPIEQQILQALGGRARHPEEVCVRTGIAAVAVQQSILTLLVRGLVEERPGGRFKSCAPTSES